MKSLICYLVLFGDWDIDESSAVDKVIPNKNKIDDRTIRQKNFTSKREAFKYAKEYLDSRLDDEWLAYLEIKKCDIQTFKKLK